MGQARVQKKTQITDGRNTKKNERVLKNKMCTAVPGQGSKRKRKGSPPICCWCRCPNEMMMMCLRN